MNEKPPDPSREAAEFARARSWAVGIVDIPPEGAEALKAADGLVRELQSIGIPLRYLDELVNINLVYPAAIPIVMAHLHRPYPDLVKDSMIRILTSRKARPEVHEALMELLRREWSGFSNQTLFALGHGIAETVPKTAFQNLVEIVMEPKYDSARTMPVQMLAKLKDPRFWPVITSYFAEGNNVPNSIRALRVGHMWDHVEGVKPLADSDLYFVRDEARKYLRAREKALGSQG